MTDKSTSSGGFIFKVNKSTYLCISTILVGAISTFR
jgi:hypothetical protein